MSQLQCFENSMFGRVRVIERDGEPWFVAKDVCECLGLDQVSRACDRLDEDERGLLKVTHPQNPDTLHFPKGFMVRLRTSSKTFARKMAGNVAIFPTPNTERSRLTR